MDRKQILIFGLCTLMSIITHQAQATCCCRRPICYFPSTSNMQGYVDVGIGESFPIFNNKPSPSLFQLYTSSSGPEENENSTITLFPKNSDQSKNLQVETGLLWRNPLYNTSYFPFISLGLSYQYNLNENKVIKLNEIYFNDENKFSYSHTADYEYSVNSLLAKMKVDFYRWRFIMPYFSIGLGKAWQKMEQKKLFDLRLIENYPSGLVKLYTVNSKKSSFTYALQGGLDFIVTDNFWLSLSYQYNHLNSIHLKTRLTAINKTVEKDMEKRDLINRIKTKSFNFNNLSTQTIQLTGRYVFG